MLLYTFYFFDLILCPVEVSFAHVTNIFVALQDIWLRDGSTLNCAVKVLLIVIHIYIYINYIFRLHYH